MREKLAIKVPELRFLEFSGEWEEKRLGQVAIFKSGGTPPKDQTQLWEGELPWISASEMHHPRVDSSQYQISEEAVKYSKTASQGDLLLLTRGSMLWNRIPICFCERRLAFNQDVKSLQTQQNSTWLFHFLYSKENRLLYSVTGTGIGAGKLDTEELKNLKTLTPTLPEQQKIAEFLTAVDEKIGKLKRKKELLDAYKKGAMQKLFSQEIRFKDDQGNPYPDWEEKTFGSTSVIKRGASPRPISSPKWFNDQSTVGWVRITDVTNSGKHLTETAQFVSEAGIAKSRFVPSGSLIMSICATLGKPVQTAIDVCIHDGFVVFESPSFDLDFAYFYLLKIQRHWSRYGQPGIQLNLNSTIVAEEPIYLPVISEQRKIAEFLTGIDDKITAVANQIDKASEFKKGLLQKMFV